MTDKGRVALVYPYFRTRSSHELLFPPLGVAALASQLHAIGINARIFDCTFSTLKNLQESLQSYRPDIVGIYSMVTMSRSTFRIAEVVRRDFPECLLVAGGPLPTLYPDNYSGQFDVVFRGEADLNFPRFCRDFLGWKVNRHHLDSLPLQSYTGLFIRQRTLNIDNPVMHFNENGIRAFPLPFRDDFNHAMYQNAWRCNDGTKTTSILTTLGCPFQCDFCSKPIFGNFFRRKSLDSVFDEISQIHRLGYTSLWIADDNFTLDLNFLREFCRRIADTKVTWSCLSRVTGLNMETVRMMKKSGCRRVYLGLETGSSETLKLMNKQTSLENGINAVTMFHKAGIETAAFFIVGYPDETIDSIEDTFSLALSLPLDIISFNVPFPLPGSNLFDRVSGIDKKKDWNTENEVTFVYNSEFDPDWLRGRIDQTMMEFADKKTMASCAVDFSKKAISRV
jgi:anaerobic magnesium-protoporphyrin IX monomethyl ester cyclase